MISNYFRTTRPAATQRGQVRVGTRKYDHHRKTFVDPSFPGFIPCVCLTASTKYGSLGPYVVRVIEDCSERGALIENAWHSFKVVPRIPAAQCTVSQYDKTVAWQYPEVAHVPDRHTQLVDMKAWLVWHDRLAHNPYPIRYPFTYSPEVRATTLGVLPPETLAAYRANPAPSTIRANAQELLGVVAGRQQVYFRFYIPAVKQQPQYLELQRMLDRGMNLLLIDVDGPRTESLPYYQETYGVPDTWIERDTILCTVRNLRIMLHDTRHSCGHTYGLAAALLNLVPEFMQRLDEHEVRQLSVDDSPAIHIRTLTSN